MNRTPVAVSNPQGRAKISGMTAPLTGSMARRVIDLVLDGAPFDEALQTVGRMLTPEETVALADELIAEQPAVAERVRGGKTAAVGALVGAGVQQSEGRVHAELLRDVLLRRLNDEIAPTRR